MGAFPAPQGAAGRRLSGRRGTPALQGSIPGLALRDRALAALDLRDAPVAVLAHDLDQHRGVIVDVAGERVARAVPLLGREAAGAELVLGVLDDFVRTDVIAACHGAKFTLRVCILFFLPSRSCSRPSTTSSSAIFISAAARRWPR